jgi:hypothetical protein
MAAAISFSIDLANEQVGRMLEAANAAPDDGSAEARLKQHPRWKVERPKCPVVRPYRT